PPHAHSLLAEQQIDDPAAANVRPLATAVVQDLGVGAASFLQGVGDQHQPCAVEVTAGKLALLVSGLRQLRHGAAEPRGIAGNGSEGVAEDVIEKCYSILAHIIACRLTCGHVSIWITSKANGSGMERSGRTDTGFMGRRDGSVGGGSACEIDTLVLSGNDVFM